MSVTKKELELLRETMLYKLECCDKQKAQLEKTKAETLQSHTDEILKIENSLREMAQISSKEVTQRFDAIIDRCSKIKAEIQRSQELLHDGNLPQSTKSSLLDRVVQNRCQLNGILENFVKKLVISSSDTCEELQLQPLLDELGRQAPFRIVLGPKEQDSTEEKLVVVPNTNCLRRLAEDHSAAAVSSQQYLTPKKGTMLIDFESFKADMEAVLPAKSFLIKAKQEDFAQRAASDKESIEDLLTLPTYEQLASAKCPLGEEKKKEYAEQTDTDAAAATNSAAGSIAFIGKGKSRISAQDEDLFL